MKVGIIGIGYWGSKVAKEYMELQEDGVIKSVHLYDINKSRQEPFKAKAHTYQEFNKFLDAVDALHLCTNNSSHYEIAKKAIESEKSVLVEKPMTTKHDEAYNLVELASEKGIILQVGHIFRFANVIRKTKELYQNGFFGKPYYVNLKWIHLMDSPKGVDILWDLLPHPLDIINFITKEWPSEFIGIGSGFRRNNLNEVAFLKAISDNLIVNFELSWLSPIKGRILEIYGSKRSAIVECVKQTIVIYEEDKAEQIKVKSNNTIREEAINFIKSIESGKNTFNSAVVGARAVEIIEKAINSIRRVGD